MNITEYSKEFVRSEEQVHFHAPRDDREPEKEYKL